MYNNKQVLQGGLGSVETKDIDEIDYLKVIPEQSRHILYGEQLQSPILGNYYKISDETKRYIEPTVLDNSLTHVSYKLSFKGYYLTLITFL